MILPNQSLKIKIVRKAMKEWYNMKGYQCEVGQTITINAADLTPNSHKKIKYICDYCGAEFERIPYSNKRSKNETLADACPNCRIKRQTTTCQARYGVDSVMQVPAIQLKCEAAKNNPNFQNDKNYSASGFVSGIPVSKGQYLLAEYLPNFILNYHYQQYYLDLYYNGVAIEYDGRGHDLGVRMGSLTLEAFTKKEKIKQANILQSCRLLRIKDPHDKILNKTFDFKTLIAQIENFILSAKSYAEIEIK